MKFELLKIQEEETEKLPFSIFYHINELPIGVFKVVNVNGTKYPDLIVNTGTQKIWVQPEDMMIEILSKHDIEESWLDDYVFIKTDKKIVIG